MSDSCKIGGSGPNVQDLMKLLQSGQNQEIDLAKKMIKLNMTQVSQSEAEGKGQIVDILA